jgi:hypothetical protein
MMNRASVERRAEELAASLLLSPEDWAAVIDQAMRMMEIVATLDELPLATVEPAAIYRLAPAERERR